MKFNFILLTTILSSLFIACSSAPEEEAKSPQELLNEAVATHLKLDSISCVVSDTIRMSDIDAAIAQLDSSKAIIDSQAVRLPKKIAATKLRIAQNEETAENMSFPMLKEQMLEVNVQERQNLARFEQILKDSQDLNTKNEAYRQRCEQAKAAAKGDVCYIVADVETDSALVKVMTSLDYKVLWHTSEAK